MNKKKFLIQFACIFNFWFVENIFSLDHVNMSSTNSNDYQSVLLKFSESFLEWHNEYFVKNANFTINETIEIYNNVKFALHQFENAKKSGQIFNISNIKINSKLFNAVIKLYEILIINNFADKFFLLKNIFFNYFYLKL